MRSWKRWTHQKSTRKDSLQKRWCFPKKMENSFFQSQMDESKSLGGDQDLRTSTLIRQRRIRGDGHVHFLGESEGSLPPPHDSFPDACEAINDFWSMSGNFIYRHHVEPRVKLYSPREESFLFPLKYIDVSRTTHTHTWMLCKSAASMIIIGISMGQEICLILGQVSPILIYWKRNLLTDLCGPGGDWQENI